MKKPSNKRALSKSVLDAARERIEWTFDRCEKVCVSFSAGKDSTVLTHLVADIARRRGRRFGLLFIDLEAQYSATIEHANAVFSEYSDIVDPHWVTLPLALRNAVSVFQPSWTCWDPDAEHLWVRSKPELGRNDYPFAWKRMEFEEFVDEFSKWYQPANTLLAQFVGIRADESLNRFRTLISKKKTRLQGMRWTTWKGGNTYNVYPIYDWRTEDLWTYTFREQKSYNRIYDLMHLAGLTPHQMRICQPYGDDQRKGLWLYQVLEPETWGKVVARVTGAGHGALYAKESGNILGNRTISKPAGRTWKEYVFFLLDSLPPAESENYRDKIAVFLQWYKQRGYQDGIPDEADPKEEAARKVPSWRRVCKVILKNDRLCKGLSFTQQRSGGLEKYRRLMQRRRKAWNLTW